MCVCVSMSVCCSVSPLQSAHTHHADIVIRCCPDQKPPDSCDQKQPIRAEMQTETPPRILRVKIKIFSQSHAIFQQDSNYRPQRHTLFLSAQIHHPPPCCHLLLGSSHLRASLTELYCPENHMYVTQNRFKGTLLHHNSSA